MCSADQIFFPCQEPTEEIFDMQFLASKISNVDELVTKIKVLESENCDLKEKLKSLKDSSNGMRQLYDTEKNLKDQFQNESAELTRRLSLLSQELDVLQHEHQNTKVLYEQEVAELKQNIDSQTTSINTKTRKKDKVNEFLLENIKYLYENGLLTNKIKKQFLKLTPENMECDVLWLENAECKSKPSSITKVTKVNKATMCITQSPTVTRSTCTSSFIKKVDVGINVPDDFIAVENILNEIVIDIPEVLSPIIELDDISELAVELSTIETTSNEESVLEKTVEMKSVETMTNLCNIRKKIDYVKKQPRPSSSMDSILQNLKKEPDDKVFSPINLINPQLSSLWILLGRTIFSLIGSNQIYDSTNILTINEQVQQIAKQIEDEKYREYLNQMTRSAMQTTSPPPAYQDATITTNSRKRKSTDEEEECGRDVESQSSNKKKNVEVDCIALEPNLELVHNINKKVYVTQRCSPEFSEFNESVVQKKNEQTIKSSTDSNIIDEDEAMHVNTSSISIEVSSNHDIIMDHESANTSASFKKVDGVQHNLLKTVFDELNFIDQIDSREKTSNSEKNIQKKVKDIMLSSTESLNIKNNIIQPSHSINESNLQNTTNRNPTVNFLAGNITDNRDQVLINIETENECPFSESSESTLHDVSKVSELHQNISCESENECQFPKSSQSTILDGSTSSELLPNISCESENECQFTESSQSTLHNASTSSELLPNISYKLTNENLSIKKTDEFKTQEFVPDEIKALSDHKYTRVTNKKILGVSETLFVSKNEVFDAINNELAIKNDEFRCEILIDEVEMSDINNEELVIDNDVIITETTLNGMNNETNLAEYEVNAENIEFDQSIIVVELIDENDDIEYLEEIQVETGESLEVVEFDLENATNASLNQTSNIKDFKEKSKDHGDVFNESMLMSSNENVCCNSSLKSSKENFVLKEKELNGCKTSTSDDITDLQNGTISGNLFNPINIFYPPELPLDNYSCSSDSEDGLVIDDQCTIDSVKFSSNSDCDIDEILKSFSLPPIFIEPIDEIDFNVENTDQPQNPTLTTQSLDVDSPAEPDDIDQIAHLPPKAIPLDRIDQASNLQKILSPLKPNSIFNKLLSRYNPEVKNKITVNMMPPPRNPKENKMIDRVHFIYGNYLHNMNWCVETLQKICPELQNICRIPKLFVKTIIDIIEPLSATTIERTRDQLSPPLPLFHEKTVTFIKFYEDEYLDELFIGELENRMFSLKSELGPQQLTNLTYLYIGMVDCDVQHRYKLRKFIYKCLYYYGFKSIPMIYAVISSYPFYILPKSQDPNYNNTDPMINTIITILMNTNYATQPNKIELPVFKKNEMKYFLTRKLQYKFGEHSITQLVSDLMRQLASNNVRNISYCLILVSKRRGIDWATINIIQSHLMPYLNQIIPNMQQSNEYDKRIVSCLYTISSILKTGDNAHEIIPYLNTFYKILNATEKQIIQESAVEAILRLSRFSCSEVFNRISTWNPPYKINRRVMLMLNSFIYRKTKFFWENLR